MNTSFKKSVFEMAAKVSHLTYQLGETGLLRKKSKNIDPKQIESQKIQRVVNKLKSTLMEFKTLTGKGKGIAAVQIGIPLKICVIFLNGELTVFINPKITQKSKTLYSYPEICMSANPIIAKVTRPQWVKVSYFNEFGQEKIWDNKKDRITNRVLQHEIDHMEGIINIDLVNSWDLILESDANFFKNSKFVKIRQTKS